MSAPQHTPADSERQGHAMTPDPSKLSDGAVCVPVTEKANVSELEATLYFSKRQKRKYNDLRCLMCGDQPDGCAGKVQRQNTRYVHDLSNWTCLCDVCAKENSEHWRDMWEDYYANCM